MVKIGSNQDLRVELAAAENLHPLAETRSTLENESAPHTKRLEEHPNILHQPNSRSALHSRNSRREDGDFPPVVMIDLHHKNNMFNPVAIKEDFSPFLQARPHVEHSRISPPPI
jgi:hypothetical protein